MVFGDLTSDQLILLTDVNGDGLYGVDAFSQIVPGEVRRLAALDSGVGTGAYSPQMMELTVEGGTSYVYWIDTITDVVYRGSDLNGNGVVDLGEETIWYDANGLVGSISARGVREANDGAIWWTSGGSSAEGCWRTEDLNADGDANDAGEAFQAAPGDVNMTVYTDGGPVVLTPDGSFGHSYAKGLAPYGDGMVVFARSATVAYKFEDLNDDGDTDDVDEKRLFLSASQVEASLPQNPDFADGGPLPSLEVSDGAGGTAGWAWQDWWGSRKEDHGAGLVDVVYFATGTSDSASFGTNKNNQGINGLIFRGIDGNADGDINDAGEVVLWYDGSYDTAPVQQFQKIIGMDVTDDGIYVVDLAGGSVAIHRLRDLDGDDNAHGLGEQDLFLFDMGLYNAGGNEFPFDVNGFAFVESGAAMPGGSWPKVVEISGTGCSQFGPDFPVISGSGSSAIGDVLTISADNALGGAPAFLFLGFSTTNWLGFPLPLDLGGVLGPGLAGCFLYQSSDTNFPTAFSGSGPNDGTASFALPIPNNPNLVGAKLGFQWLGLDVFVTFGLQLSDLAVAEILP